MKTRSGRLYHAVNYVRRNVLTPFAFQTGQRIVANASQRLADSITGSRTGRRGDKAILPGVISTQHDVSGRYRRKRMPRRKRKRWVGFSRKVNHVVLQMQPLNTYTVDYPGAVKTIAVNTQVTDGQMIGGVSVTQNSELLDIFRSAFGSALGINSIDVYKIYLKSMCLDLQLRNSGTNALVVDVYTLMCRRNDKNAQRIDVQYVNDFAEQGAGSGGTVDVNNPATTPFQNSSFCKRWKILAKKEILLGAGQVSTMQIRIPHNRYLSGKLLEHNVGCIPGFTRAFLIQARGVPENNAGTARLCAGELTWMAQFTAAYGVPPSSKTFDTTAQA